MPDRFQEEARDWDERPVPRIISEAVGALLRSSIAWSPTMRVIDFGAGTGLVASHVAPLVAKVAAVDTSAAMLEQLAAKTELAGKVELHNQDILEQPLGDSFDGVVSAMVMHHVPDTARLLRAFHDHLRSGGFVALADLDSEDGSFHPPGADGVFHHGFDRDALGAKLRAAGFEDVAFRTAVEVTREEGGPAYPIFLATAKRP